MSILNEKDLKSIRLELMDINRSIIRKLHNNEMINLLKTGKTIWGSESPEDKNERYLSNREIRLGINKSRKKKGVNQ